MKKTVILIAIVLLVVSLSAVSLAAVRPDSIYISTFDANDTVTTQEPDSSENAPARIPYETVEPADTAKPVEPAETAEPDEPVVSAIDETLKGLIIGIDPGHQEHSNNNQEAVSPGSKKTKPKVSSGTAGVKTRIPEYVVNLEIGLKLRDALEAKGASVVMTRDTSDVDISNIERAVMINEANADICLRLHCNGSTERSANGTQLYVKKTGEKAEESADAAKVIIDCMCAHTGAKNRGIVVNDNYTGLNWSTVPSILVEMGFMSNAREDELLSDPEYQDKLVAGMVEGIEKYFEREN